MSSGITKSIKSIYFFPKSSCSIFFMASALYSLCSRLFRLFIILWILYNRWMANCIFSSSFQSVAAVCNLAESNTSYNWSIEEVAVPKLHWSQPPLFSLLDAVLEWFLRQSAAVTACMFEVHLRILDFQLFSSTSSEFPPPGLKRRWDVSA